MKSCPPAVRLPPRTPPVMAKEGRGSLRPPSEGKHPGCLTTSTSFTGSQNEIFIPTRGTGEPQKQRGNRPTVSVPSPGVMATPPIFIGNIAPQSTSETGLKNLPPHLADAAASLAALTSRAPRKSARRTLFRYIITIM